MIYSRDEIQLRGHSFYSTTFRWIIQGIKSNFMGIPIIHILSTIILVYAKNAKSSHVIVNHDSCVVCWYALHCQLETEKFSNYCMNGDFQVMSSYPWRQGKKDRFVKTFSSNNFSLSVMMLMKKFLNTHHFLCICTGPVYWFASLKTPFSGQCLKTNSSYRFESRYTLSTRSLKVSIDFCTHFKVGECKKN